VRHLHFTQSLEPLEGGGLGTSTVSLHRQMLKLGFESRLCATFSGAPCVPAEETIQFRRVGPGFLYMSPQLLRRADDLVSKSDVVHGHGLYVGPNQAFGHAARRRQKPLVYHVHGMFEPYILNRSRWKKKVAHLLFEDANFRHACLWRALTSKEADQIRARGIDAPIVVVPNGVDLHELARPETDDRQLRPLTQIDPRLRALFLGRLHPKKGLDLLLPAWARVNRFHNDWKLLIAGPDENGYKASLQSAVTSLQLDSTVEFIGPVTGKAKAALLHSASLFILPSYSEGFPMSLLEAMACSVPVVATSACNFPELAQAEAGWECDPCLSSLTGALELALAAGPAERRQRGARGKQLVELNYTWPIIVQRLLEACQAHCK